MTKEKSPGYGPAARSLHHNMSLVGGFFAGYAILSRGAMANAQTLNLADLAINLCGHNIHEALWHLGSFALYFIAAMLFTVIYNKKPAAVQPLGLVFDAAAVAVSGLLPENCRPMIALYPICFAMSFQWNAFSSADGYVSSTIFSTNNTRQTAMALAEYLFLGEKQKLDKAAFFLGSLLFFNGGVALSCFAVKRWGVCAIFWNYVFLVVAAILTFVQNKQKNS